MPQPTNSPDSSTPDPSAEPQAAPAAPAPSAPPAPNGISAEAWVQGNGPLQVPVAGLLASDPSLREQDLPPEQWQELLDEYLTSERP